MTAPKKHVLIDHSVFIGQFSITNEPLRLCAKHKLSQIGIGENPELIAVETFEENGYTDDTLWGLPTEVQDEFFPFMDLFHSLLQIEREPLQQKDAELALEIARECKCHLSNALSSAVAIRRGIGRILSFYHDFQEARLQEYLKRHHISVDHIDSDPPSEYPVELEPLYDRALKGFQSRNIDLTEFPHN